MVFLMYCSPNITVDTALSLDCSDPMYVDMNSFRMGKADMPISQRRWECIPGVDRVISVCRPISKNMTDLLRHHLLMLVSSPEEKGSDKDDKRALVPRSILHVFPESFHRMKKESTECIHIE